MVVAVNLRWTTDVMDESLKPFKDLEHGTALLSGSYEEEEEKKRRCRKSRKRRNRRKQ